MTATVTLRLALAALVCALAAYTDWKHGKVYNWLTAPAAVAGLLLGAVGGGWIGLATSFAGLAAGLASGVLAAAVGAPFGGGDIKLLAAIGALGGPPFLLRTAIYGILIGGLAAMAIALLRGTLSAAVKSLFTFICAKLLGARPITLSAVSHAGTMPFAVAIAAGCWLAIALPYHWPV